MVNRFEEGADMKTEQNAVECDACRLVPISVLGLDLAQPISGWEQMLADRGVEVVEDDLGRASISRSDARALIEDRRQRESRLAAERTEKAAARQVAVVPAGVPALEDGSPYESMMAAGGISPAEEFGRPAPSFLETELEEGRQHAAARRAAVKRRKAKQ